MHSLDWGRSSDPSLNVNPKFYRIFRIKVSTHSHTYREGSCHKRPGKSKQRTLAKYHSSNSNTGCKDENMTRNGKIISILESPAKRNFFFFLVKFCATAKILHFLCFETSQCYSWQILVCSHIRLDHVQLTFRPKVLWH